MGVNKWSFYRACKVVMFETALAATILAMFAAPSWAQRVGPVSLGVPSSASAALPAEANRVHVVLLADTTSADIGIPCGKDIVAFRKTLLTGFEEKGNRLVFHDFTGMNPFSKRAWLPGEVFQYLANLPRGDNETLVIFHSGHGSIRNGAFPERTHFLGLNAGVISVGSIYESLRGRHYRALILLTDSCSNIVGGTPLPRVAGVLAGAESLNSESVQNLFLRPVGEISITAAEDGTSAKAAFQGANPAEAGSAFTVALLRLLYDKNKTYRCWTDIFPILREETYLASGSSHRARAFVLNEVGLIRVEVDRPAPDRIPPKPNVSGKSSTFGPKWSIHKPLVAFPRGPARMRL